MEVGKRKILYLSLHCHHQNDFYIKMGSNVSHFNISLIVRDKVTRRCPQTTTFEEKGEPNRGPSAYQPNALPLGQAGSLIALYRTAHFYTQTSSSSVTESLSYISSSSDTRSCE